VPNGTHGGVRGRRNSALLDPGLFGLFFGFDFNVNSVFTVFVFIVEFFFIPEFVVAFTALANAAADAFLLAVKICGISYSGNSGNNTESDADDLDVIGLFGFFSE